MSELDLSTIFNQRGILRLVQALVNLLGAVFCLASWAHGNSDINFFEFVGITGFILDLLFIAMEIGTGCPEANLNFWDSPQSI